MKTVVVCVDKNGGQTRLGRRLASDRAVRSRIASLPQPVCVDEYTATQFTEDEDRSRLSVVSDPAAIKEGTAFLERQDIPDDADTILVFRWDKRYPADRYLAFRFRGWRKARKEDFPGDAHDKVTLETWVRKKEAKA